MRRRRMLLGRLVTATVLTVLLAMLVGGMAWFLAVAAAALTLGYIGLLAQLNAERVERVEAARRRHAPKLPEPEHRVSSSVMVLQHAKADGTSAEPVGVPSSMRSFPSAG